MGLLDLLFGRAERAEVPPAAVTLPHQVYPQAVPWLDGTSILGLSSVWRCVTLIADAIADFPWREWQGPEDAPVELQPSRLVRRPSGLMTRREWTWRVVATEALYNVCHLWHVGGTDETGAPWSLLPIPPDAITPIGGLDPWGLVPPDEYLVGSSRVSALDLTIVRRAPFPNVPDHLAAILNLARREFSAFLAADVAASRYWQAGGPVTTVISTDQPLTKPEADEIAQRWADRRTMGADFPAVMGKGAEAKPWGADPTTESAVRARQEMVADVGRYFGVPTRILNAPAGDSETYANTEEDRTDLLRYTLRGYMGPVEDAISTLLPGDYILGRRMEMDTTEFSQGSLADRATAWSALVTSGIVTKDEARRRGFALAPMGAGSPRQEPNPDALPAAFAAVSGDGPMAMEGMTNG